MATTSGWVGTDPWVGHEQWPVTLEAVYEAPAVTSSAQYVDIDTSTFQPGTWAFEVRTFDGEDWSPWSTEEARYTVQATVKVPPATGLGAAPAPSTEPTAQVPAAVSSAVLPAPVYSAGSDLQVLSQGFAVAQGVVPWTNVMGEVSSTFEYLRTEFSIVAAGGNQYRYVSVGPSYTVQTGDMLELDVYWETTDARIGFDTQVPWRDGSLLDQNGLDSHPSTLVPANQTWYHREFDISPKAGQTVTFQLVSEHDGGTSAGRFRNFRIRRGGATVFTLWDGGQVPVYNGLGPNSNAGNTHVFTAMNPYSDLTTNVTGLIAFQIRTADDEGWGPWSTEYAVVDVDPKSNIFVFRDGAWHRSLRSIRHDGAWTQHLVSAI